MGARGRECLACLFPSQSWSIFGQLSSALHRRISIGTVIFSVFVFHSLPQLKEGQDDSFLKDLGLKNANHRKALKKQISFLRVSSDDVKIDSDSSSLKRLLSFFFPLPCITLLSIRSRCQSFINFFEGSRASRSKKFGWF